MLLNQQKIQGSVFNLGFRFIGLFLTLSLSASASAFDHSHRIWNEILQKNIVSVGPMNKVKYNDLQKNRGSLELYLKEISSVSLADYQSWTETQKLAFLFNSYNALTVDLILSHHSPEKPLKSIKEIGSILKSTWKIKFFKFLGEKSSLDHIEQELARPNFDEPRMHFAFNCASMGCPNLGKEAFVAEKLDNQLDTAARNFLSDKTRNTISKNQSALELSQIFNWYGEDFESSKKFKSLRQFLTAHMDLPKPVQAQLLDGRLPIKFLDYNWNLNIAE